LRIVRVNIHSWSFPIIEIRFFITNSLSVFDYICIRYEVACLSIRLNTILWHSVGPCVYYRMEHTSLSMFSYDRFQIHLDDILTRLVMIDQYYDPMSINWEHFFVPIKLSQGGKSGILDSKDLRSPRFVWIPLGFS
jgi:hypothetical protein